MEILEKYLHDNVCDTLWNYLNILFIHYKFNFRYEKIIDALSSSIISKIILLESKYAGTMNNVLVCDTEDTIVRN